MLFVAELTRAFGLAPGALGFLTSAFFLTLAGAQLPLGILIGTGAGTLVGM